MKLRILGAALGVSFMAATSGVAAPVSFDFSWEGTSDFSMVGSFTGEDANADGFIRDGEVSALTFEGFDGATSLGVSTDSHLLADFNFNFDLGVPGFLLGGNSSSANGQQWNVRFDGTGIGFESGSFSASFYFDGFFDRASQTVNPNTISVTEVAPVPLPAGLPLLLGGLGILGLMRRARRQS